MTMPLSTLPEMMLRAFGSLPPMMLFDAPDVDRDAHGVGERVVARHVGADQVALDTVARRVSAVGGDHDAVGDVAGDEVTCLRIGGADLIPGCA